MITRNGIFAVLSTIAMLASGCVMPKDAEAAEPVKDQPKPVIVLEQEAPTPSEEPAGMAVGTFAAYWDFARGVAEFGRIETVLQSLCLADLAEKTSLSLFALDFKPDGQLNQNEGLDFDAAIDFDTVYLTVVNDVVDESGTDIQKDPKILETVLGTETARTALADALMVYVDRYELDGIELDFERVPDGQWTNYISLIEELAARLRENNKTLRVFLETRCPIEELSFPEDCTYIMMAYNLYGLHSGPGPKADDAFIREIANRMTDNVTRAEIAFSLGGFDWSGDTVRAVTRIEAERILADHGITPARDAESGALNFIYEADGVSHTVWYADGETIRQWVNTAQEAGISNLSLWRLGGNIITETDESE